MMRLLQESYSSKASQQYQKIAQNFLQILIDFVNFLWQNCPIFNNSRALGLNITKLTP